MRMVILDPDEKRRIIRRRQLTGADRFDEVWNGVYVMSPIADNEHQAIATMLSAAFIFALGALVRGTVLAGTNVSDRREGWKKNYRCPDVAVYLPGNPAEDRGTYWLGGPDFAAEILSPGDRSRKKLTFYAKVGVRELLLIDRDPWALELYRLEAGALTLVGKSVPETSEVLTGAVLPMTFRLLPGDPRPQIELTHADGRNWPV